jgi:solute carrier family 50 protein (sugar transporter)
MSWEIDPRIANGIALLGSFTAIVMWLAPVRDIWTAEYSVYRTKSTENVATGFGFVAGCFNCILWNMFASTRLETMLVPLVVNSVGLLLNSSFSLCYYCYGDRKARRETCRQLLLMLFVTALSIIFWVVENDNHIVGYFAAFVNVLMLFGPLAAAGDVIRNRSSKGMSLLPMIMTLLSSIVWLAYGVYIKEIPSMIPNALGVFFGIAQIILFFWARSVERKEQDEEAINEAFDPVTAGMSSSVQRPRLASLGSLIAEGP